MDFHAHVWRLVSLLVGKPDSADSQQLEKSQQNRYIHLSLHRPFKCLDTLVCVIIFFLFLLFAAGDSGFIQCPLLQNQVCYCEDGRWGEELGENRTAISSEWASPLPPKEWRMDSGTWCKEWSGNKLDVNDSHLSHSCFSLHCGGWANGVVDLNL